MNSFKELLQKSEPSPTEAGTRSSPRGDRACSRRSPGFSVPLEVYVSLLYCFQRCWTR